MNQDIFKLHLVLWHWHARISTRMCKTYGGRVLSGGGLLDWTTPGTKTYNSKQHYNNSKGQEV
jgi:hypothetical protein